jgi:galactoside O-acetyltransferase
MYYTKEELNEIGFKNLGENIKISKKCSIYNSKNIEIGSNVRIDDFCIISAGENGIKIGNNVHIACYVSLIGNGRIYIGDFCGISSKTSIYSSTDDYSGDYLTSPVIPKKYTNVINGDVILEKHVIIGSGCIILPNIKLSEGVAVGALSLVNKSFESFQMIGGIPAKIIKPRSKKLLILEKQYNEES